MQTYGITSPRGFPPAGAIFRALSLHLHGVQNHHLLLRLSTALEKAEHRDFYDKTGSDFKDLVNEVKITVAPYSELMEDGCRQGGYMEMIYLYAASAVINVPFKSYFPPTSNDYLSGVQNHTVCGRGVRCNEKPDLWLMWSSMTVPAKIEDFNANHFVVMKLVPTPVQHGVIDLNQSTLTEESWPAPPTASGSNVKTLSVAKSSRGRKKKLQTIKQSSLALHTTKSSADPISSSDITNDASMCWEIQKYPDICVERPAAPGGKPLPDGFLPLESIV